LILFVRVCPKASCPTTPHTTTPNPTVPNQTLATPLPTKNIFTTRQSKSTPNPNTSLNNHSIDPTNTQSFKIINSSRSAISSTIQCNSYNYQGTNLINANTHVYASRGITKPNISTNRCKSSKENVPKLKQNAYSQNTNSNKNKYSKPTKSKWSNLKKYGKIISSASRPKNSSRSYSLNSPNKMTYALSKKNWYKSASRLNPVLVNSKVFTKNKHYSKSNSALMSSSNSKKKRKN
jgi:hypothetical protein